jgi:putative flavoprotein involved in K+ transport
MRTTETIIIGAGQAGLAMSHCLTDAGDDHVVLERGRLAERWRSERWDSLRLLTPNWAARLPGWQYQGDDPDGYMTAGQVVRYFESYADSFDAPVHEGTTVLSLRRDGDGFSVTTDEGDWLAAQVVIATGWCDRPLVPRAAIGLSSSVAQLTPSTYRNPDQLPKGSVLVVGASASGVQLADELARAGRHVVLAAGHHTRIPRRYRGLDIFWWLEQMGTFSKTIDEMPDPERARREPSLQLVGRPDGRSLDLVTLEAAGVRLAGRLVGIDDTAVRFADDLRATTAVADARMNRVLGEIDAFIEARGLDREVLPPRRPRGLRHPRGATGLDLRRAGITTVIWATGFERPYSWLHVPVLDRHGEISQRRGVTSVPGLYVLGQRFQHTRHSNFIDGVRHDAAFVAHHLTQRARPLQRLAS